MNVVCRNTALPYASIKQLTAMLKRGKEPLEDDPRQGRIGDVITEEMLSKVQEYMLKNGRVVVSPIAMEIGIRVGSVEKYCMKIRVFQWYALDGYPEF